MHKRVFFFKTPLIYIGCCFLLISSITYGQSSWKRIENSSISQFPVPLVKEHFYERIPTRDIGQTSKSELSILDQIILPNEEGEEELFLIKPVQVISPSISSKYQYIQTYRGYSKTRPDVKVRLSIHRSKINAWIQIPGKKDLFIQPVKAKKYMHFVYQKTKNDKAQEFLCKTVEENSKVALHTNSRKEVQLNTELRIFRIAVAGTAEYTSYWGDDDPSNGTNAEDAYAAVVSTINRINQVFEDELGIRLELVSDAALLYEDPTTDPFSGNFSTELQSTIDQELGDEAYDIGHLFDFGEPNGDAGCIGCVCESGAKAQGYSTHPFEDIYGGEYRNDYFDLDYAAHEIGHQFGAYHTFSYNTEGTDVNAEPGSGTTIMGYAGITGPDDVQLHGDPYFHYYSIQNITNYVETLSCGETELLSSFSFSIDAGPDFYIPIGTPYTLSITPLEGEEITYAWEQLDSGQVTSDNFGPYNPKGSMARSLPPKTKASRSIPNLQSLLQNELTLENPSVGDSWETLSLVERNLEWGLSVRKNVGDHVQVAQDKMEISVVATSTPFAVNSQASASLVWKGGSYQTIVWDVAETNVPPFDVSTVEILLSTDGGSNFNTLLAEDVPNTGEAIIFVPNSIDTSMARLKIKANGNIFFAINRATFSVESRQFGLSFDKYQQNNCDSESIQYNFNILREEGFDASFSFQANELPNGVQAVFSKTSYSSSDNSGSVIFRGLDELSSGDYEFQISAVYGSQSEPYSVSLNQRESSLEQPLLQSPLNNAENQTVIPQLKWESNINADTYQLQVATDSSFQNIILDRLVSQNQYNTDKLNSDKQYYWRVKQQNICGESFFSETFTFRTTTISCVEVSSTGLPKNITDATASGQGVTTASLNVNYNLPIQDIDVMVDIEHTYLEDLILYLETPDGTQYLLTSQLGDSENDYNNTVFDQEASASISSGSPPFTGSFRPLQSIAALYSSSPQGTWRLIVQDNYEEDTGRLVNFSLKLCLEGIPQTNSDNDSFVDEEDNCPEISNEDQADLDNNGIGDVCDIFSTQNISITKKDTSCFNKANGSVNFSARADYVYRAEIRGNNGYTKNLVFTTQGNGVANLAAGNYSICVTSSSFPDFEYCFETQIKEPEPLEVISSFNTLNSIMNLSLSGSNHYYITLNDGTFEVEGQDEIKLPLARKLNRIEVKTANSCQGVFEQWINASQKASVFPNPITENASLVLPENAVVDILLLSGSGTLLWENKNIQSDGRTIQIPMSRLNPGFYLLQVLYPDSTQSIKLLKR